MDHGADVATFSSPNSGKQLERAPTVRQRLPAVVRWIALSGGFDEANSPLPSWDTTGAHAIDLQDVTLESRLREPEGLLRVALSHLALVRCKRGENLCLLALRDLEDVKRSPEFSRDFVELSGRDVQFAMGFFQAERGAAWLCRRILLRAAGNFTDPQSAHELEAWKSGEVAGVPLPERRILGLLADNRILHHSVAEMVNHRRDGESATKPVIQLASVIPSLLHVVGRASRSRCPSLRRLWRFGFDSRGENLPQRRAVVATPGGLPTNSAVSR
jgi:hypothetical protein